MADLGECSTSAISSLMKELTRNMQELAELVTLLHEDKTNMKVYHSPAGKKQADGRAGRGRRGQNPLLTTSCLKSEALEATMQAAVCADQVLARICPVLEKHGAEDFQKRLETVCKLQQVEVQNVLRSGQKKGKKGKGKGNGKEKRTAVSVRPFWGIGKKKLVLSAGAHGEIGQRSRMEDAHTLAMNYEEEFGTGPSNGAAKYFPDAFFGVFDGHGGSWTSKHVSDAMPRALLKHKNYELDLGAALKSSMVVTDRRLLRQCAKQLEYSGSTAITATIRGNQLFVANLGDSRAVLSRDRVAIAMSSDHSPTRPDEKRRIESSGGQVTSDGINNQLSVSRAFGDLDYKGHKHEFFPELALTSDLVLAQAEVTKTRIVEQDRFMILACDGLWDVMSNQEAVDFCNRLLDNDWALLEERVKIRKRIHGLLEKNASLNSRALKHKLVSLFPKINFNSFIWKNWIEWVLGSISSECSGEDLELYIEPLPRPPTALELAGYLVREALIRGSTDNVSTLVIGFHWI